MAPRWIIVDGYSLLYRINPGSHVSRGDLQRSRLTSWLDKAAPFLAERITIVFDGRGPAAETPKEISTLEVVYSPAHQTADTVIERLVCSAPNRNEIMVITSDRAERHNVEAAGAVTMSCGDFLELCRRATSQLERHLGQSSRKDKGPTLGDFFPKSE